MVVKSLNFYGFQKEFEAYGRDKQFSSEGLNVLYHYIEDLAEESGEQYFLDVIEVCTTFSEYDTIEECLEEYGLQSLEELEKNTAFLILDNGGIIIQNY